MSATSRRAWFVVRTTVIFAAAALVAGCGLLPFLAQAIDRDFRPAPFRFDLTGAVAVAGNSSGSRSLRGVSPRMTGEEEARLVKILESGAIESAMDYGGRDWTPEIAFISLDDDGRVYVGFMHSYHYWHGGSFVEAQLVRIDPATNEAFVIWPPAGKRTYEVGSIDTWNSMWLNQDPMVKGPGGTLYFKTEAHSSYGVTSHQIWRYDPLEGGDPVQQTPVGVPLTFDQFSVDVDEHLIIQSSGSYGDATYLRYYTPGVPGFHNVYYSSSSDVYVRSFAPVPGRAHLIVNGQNIRGMSGIIRVEITGPDSVDCVLLYPSSGTSVVLFKPLHWAYESSTTLLNQIVSSATDESFMWSSGLYDTDGNLDWARVEARVRPYFIDSPTATAELRSLVAGAATPDDALSLLIGSPARSLRDWITNRPSQFLATYFDGVLFTTWLSGQEFGNLSFDSISDLHWTSDGALYGMYGWYSAGSGGSQGPRVVKLLDAHGNRDLRVVPLAYGDRRPTMVKIIGDRIYYRYAVLDGTGQETGRHRLASYDIVTEAETDLLPGGTPAMEILDYDVSDDHTTLYVLGLNPGTNQAVNGRLDLVTSTWGPIDNSIRLSRIRVIQ